MRYLWVKGVKTDLESAIQDQLDQLADQKTMEKIPGLFYCIHRTCILLSQITASEQIYNRGNMILLWTLRLAEASVDEPAAQASTSAAEMQATSCV